MFGESGNCSIEIGFLKQEPASNYNSLNSQEGEYTVVRFGHRKWKEEVEFTAHCSTKWAIFRMSLKDLVETGKGRPAPEDVVISDWH